MIKDQPLITTIIPTYERPNLLRRAVNSVLMQSYSNVQVCVYDNASSDETPKVMKELCSKDSRIRYHRHPKNIGMMANYEYGLARIDSPFFSILSDDDYLMPWFYETALKEFENYSDAAFVACGVLAVNSKGVVVAEPLGKWNREGYFDAIEGAIEMIEDKARLPIPTSILFQHRLVKEVSPDFNKEMQLMWDPDYLVQIAVRFPFIITRKVCGLFMTHGEGFSSEFYQNVFEKPKLLEIYFKATKKMIFRIKENPHLSFDVKKRVIQTMVKMIRVDMTSYIKRFMFLKNFNGAYLTAELFYRYYGRNLYMWFLLVPVFFYVYVPITRLFLRAVLKLKRKLRASQTSLNYYADQYGKYQKQIQEVLAMG